MQASDGVGEPARAQVAVVKAWDRAGNQATAEHSLTVSNPAPHIAVAPLGRARWSFWETLHFEVATTCLPIARMWIVVEGPGRNRTETWGTGGWPGPAADGSRPQKYGVDWRWDTRWDAGPYAGPGEYPVRFEAWDAWGRKWMERGCWWCRCRSRPRRRPGRASRRRRRPRG